MAPDEGFPDDGLPDDPFWREHQRWLHQIAGELENHRSHILRLQAHVEAIESLLTKERSSSSRGGARSSRGLATQFARRIVRRTGRLLGTKSESPSSGRPSGALQPDEPSRTANPIGDKNERPRIVVLVQDCPEASHGFRWFERLVLPAIRESVPNVVVEVLGDLPADYAELPAGLVAVGADDRAVAIQRAAVVVDPVRHTTFRAIGHADPADGELRVLRPSERENTGTPEGLASEMVRLLQLAAAPDANDRK